jgi:hypothetical protein
MGYSRSIAPIVTEWGNPWGPNTVLAIAAGANTYIINSLGKLYWSPYKLAYAYIDLGIGGIHDTSGATNHLSLLNSIIEYSTDGGANWHDSGATVPTCYCPANGWIYPQRFFNKYDIKSWLVQDTQIDLRISTDGALANNLELWGVYPILRVYLE